MSSGVWAAMRDRRLLSARGHPDRLREKRRQSEGKTRKARGEKDVSEGKSKYGLPRSFRN